MTHTSLAAAYQAALNTDTSPPRREPDNARSVLVGALKNSTTRNDQIIQRRIGITVSSPRDLLK